MQGWKDSLRDPKHARFKREAKGCSPCAAQNAGIALGKARERLRGSRGRPSLPPSPGPAPVPLPSEPPALHPLAPGSADAIPGVGSLTCRQLVAHRRAGGCGLSWQRPLVLSPFLACLSSLTRRVPAWGDLERLWESSGCSQPCPASISLPLSITPAYCSLFLFISRRKLM